MKNKIVNLLLMFKMNNHIYLIYSQSYNNVIFIKNNIYIYHWILKQNFVK